MNTGCRHGTAQRLCGSRAAAMDPNPGMQGSRCWLADTRMVPPWHPVPRVPSHPWVPLPELHREPFQWNGPQGPLAVILSSSRSTHPMRGEAGGAVP